MKKTSIPNPVKSLGYIKCQSLSRPRPVKSLAILSDTTVDLQFFGFFFFWAGGLGFFQYKAEHFNWDSLHASLKQMRFSRSTCLLMFLPLETLTFIIRTGLPVLVELIDLLNSALIFLSQMTLLRWLTFLLRSQAAILIVLLF